MLTTQKSEFRFDLSGGQLALDLANTVSRRDDPARRKDHLESYSDVVSFTRQSKVISPKQAQELRAYGLRHPTEARRSLGKTIALREAIYRVFSAIAQWKPANAGDLRTINDCAIEALQHRAIEPVNGGYGWQWVSDANHPLEQVMWRIAQAAADLLISDELPMVCLCQAPDCDWLFLDRSRNRSRRWCDMTTCGNRAKARRHYQRTQD